MYACINGFVKIVSEDDVVISEGKLFHNSIVSGKKNVWMCQSDNVVDK